MKTTLVLVLALTLAWCQTAYGFGKEGDCCSESSECLERLCCVRNPPSEGKKRIACPGTCKPRGGLNAMCVVGERIGKKTYCGSCPCQCGFSCNPNSPGDFEGHCQENSR